MNGYDVNVTTAESIEPSMLPTTILSQLALCSAHRRCKNEGVQTARRGMYKKNEDGIMIVVPL